MTELSEANNARYQNLVVENPDFQVSSLSFNSPSGAGRTLSVTDTTANTSAGDSFVPMTTKLYLSSDRVLDADDILLGSRSVPVLAAGRNSVAATSVTIPTGTPAGAYYLLAAADADGAVTERSEANNISSQGLTIENPDLQISGLSIAAGAGRTMSVTDTTWNSSAGDAGLSTTKLYFSSDTILDADDILLASRAVGALAAGKNSAAATTVTIPAGTPAGAYYVIAVADADGSVAERSEANNTLSRSLIIRPDMQLSAFSFVGSAAPGMTFSVKETTANVSIGDADASTTTLYLSRDAAIDAGDPVLGSRTVPALAAGTSSIGETMVTIPAGTPAGVYYVMAKGDADNTVLELSELNNILYRAIVITQ
jgi:subtilase family serine protease